MARQIMDGCTAATHVAYALSDVATIYPISPIAEMGEKAQKWGLIDKRKNLMGQAMDVRELESELGAAGATHGALAAGALATTFTCSQGLMLMIPNMYKIAGEQLPAVFHVGTRSVASHALSIFGDHQDVMGCRATGFTFLASASVQETMDLALVAHLAAIDGSLPVVHFFDGWRTSNEWASIDVIDYETMRPLVNWDNVARFRKRGLNPERPVQRGSAQNPGVFFQNREAVNPLYDKFPAVMQAAMDRVGRATGRYYHLVDYTGAPDATDVMVIMGSGGVVATQVVEELNRQGKKTGVVQVRMFQPFPAAQLLSALPATVKRLIVMDRTKEPGAFGEPLYLECAAALQDSGRAVKVYGGRYGLSSKQFDPSMVASVFAAAGAGNLHRQFTVGINDDVTRLSVPSCGGIDLPEQKMYQTIFYGMGADGAVGATKLAAAIASDAGMCAQAYFNYSAKKSGGYTLSQLRIAQEPVRALYDIEHADFVGCYKATYVTRFRMLDKINEGGIFLLNSPWSLEALEKQLPASMKQAIARKKVRFFNVDAVAVAAKAGLGMRVNTVMITAFLYLSKVLPFDSAKADLLKRLSDTYIHEGEDVVARNVEAVNAAVAAIKEVAYPASWADATDGNSYQPESLSAGMPPAACGDFVAKIARPCFELLGNDLPVSLFVPDGAIPPGTTAYEKRRIAINVPQWNPQKCITCTQCSLVCAHAAIRPVLMDAQEAAAAPQEFVSVTPKGGLNGYKFRIQVFAEDCTGCGSCATICPGHALDMVPAEPQFAAQAPLVNYSQTKVTYKGGQEPRFTVRGSQLYQPLLQFSGACGGCGETPYVKLLTQLFGERMIVANATGCSSIWGASYPSNPYCANSCGHGPAWANSLFEDNAEYGYGMAVAVAQQRSRLKDAATALSAQAGVATDVATAAKAWVASFDDPEASVTAGKALMKAMESMDGSKVPGWADTLDLFRRNADWLGAKSVWAIGGDGWAYDIGFAGLDHVLASGQNINILVLDTECYSNTGGQTSKATPLGAIAQYSPLGKRVVKKDLARMMMAYTDVYVAQIALGANYQHTIEVLKEAEAYPGPSMVVAYCPCIEHGIKAGMGTTIVEEKRAVQCGYWNLFSYNPALAAQGQNPFKESAAAPVQADFVPYLDGENRYADLLRLDPQAAAKLRPELQKHLDQVYTHMSKLDDIPPA